MWFSKSTEEVLQELNVDQSTGLTESEVQTKLSTYGPNVLQSKKKKSIVQMFLSQLKDWLIYVLFAAVLVTLLMGEYVDAVIIMLVIILNAVLGVVQEVKAGNAIEALQKIASPKALVKRDGVVKEVNAEDLVPGDILVLDAGRFIAADIRLIETVGLQVEESALTGESVPVLKDAAQIYQDPRTPLGERENTAFMSTLVTAGRGLGVVVETGMKTEVGKIASLIGKEGDRRTPLEIRLNKLGKTLGKLAIGICVFIFIVALLQGRDLVEMFLLSVSLAVASIPEGLAAIVAIVLSIGVTTMSKKNAIIRRLPAVETLGSVNIICSDKTGTLTQNKMTVTRYFNLEGNGSVIEGEGSTPTEDTKFLAKAMILCSDATYEQDEETGDPTEIALLKFGDDLGIDRKGLQEANKRVAEQAFDSDRKLMSTLYEEDGKLTVYTKGAVDKLLKISNNILYKEEVIPLNDAHKQQYAETIKEMSSQSLRVLGAAYKPVDTEIHPTEMEKDLIFLGLVGMIDPPRPEVKSSVEKAKGAGIATVMITGDHKETAFAIAKELHIADRADQAISGAEIEDYSEEEFADRVASFRIFARVSPAHKVKIVEALQSKGNIVSMTGDGVNDAPSLQAANIGVAMGITGTDVAKGAADMILTDDNFATIVMAIEQGRNIYKNIKKSIIFLLTCNLGEVVVMFVCLLLGWEAPLIATQLLWINLVTDTFPAVALGMDPSDPDVMKEKPRDPKESFFAEGAGVRAIFGGLLIGLLTAFAFWYGFYEQGSSPFAKSSAEGTVQYARTLAFMTLVACQLFYALAKRSDRKSIFSIGVFSNKYLIGAILIGFLLQLIVITVPVMQSAFRLQMLDLKGWAMVICLGLFPLFVSELAKVLKKKDR